MLQRKLRNLQSYADWPKVKPGEVLVVPKDNRLLEHPPFRNSAGWPEWFKSAGKNGVAIAGCKGIQDYLSLGITVPLWGDVKIHTTEGGGVNAVMADSFFSTEQFGAETTKGCPFMEERPVEHAGCPDLRSPYLYKTAPGYSLLCLPVLYEPDPRYQVLPSVINSDYFHRGNVVLRVLVDGEFIIPAGTPIYHLIPFKRSDQVKSVVLGDEYMHKHADQRGVGHGGFQTFRRKGVYRRHQRQVDNCKQN